MSKFRLDEVDHQILDMLIDNTRVPFTDIAKKLLISAGTVHVRVKKMEDAGMQKRIVEQLKLAQQRQPAQKHRNPWEAL
jgi:DNA-binding Lrp family transcriptional regulator